ncbi:type II toxin-antitoxin system VapC family toxin [Sphingomonas psychrolutea]|uniref:Ribonuclease VapC n=1 Tax=Sphingomonas psychrolutea TaxID=1259676 RepID=A0ABQ1H457_9SPHN|nr:type II toxin-antitoxin system VapC family toxin [Sphingomonas psychrolutea]GGA57171.1 ribonuclease VapC [Sphingomonas psychrolutea]
MIALDGSALFAVILDEPMAERCDQALRAAGTELIMSSASLTETLIVAAGKNLYDEMQAFIAALQPTIIPLTEPRARAAADAYRRWGKNFHPARLNLGDSFAYALAMEHACPLLFVGNDFAQTDVVSALAG